MFHTKFSAHISSNIQNLVTICLAIFVALSISLLAQVVILSFQKKISSAALHQYSVANSSKYLALDVNRLSLSGRNHVTHSAHHLDTIDILCTGSVFGSNFQTRACHTSW
jgi:hypothetical protein